MTCRRPRGPAGAARGQGFTLVELLVVLLIVGLVAGLALPRWSRLVRREALSVGAREVASMVRLAREKAVLCGSGCVLVYGEKALRLEWQDGQQREFQRQLPDGVAVTGVRAGGSLAEPSGAWRVAFTAAGTTTEHTVLLAISDGRLAEVAVEPLTCTASIRLRGAGK
jgi:type II secretion system protein H